MVIIIVHVTQHVKSIKNFDLLPKKINKTIQIEVKTGLYNWSCIIRKKKEKEMKMEMEIEELEALWVILEFNFMT